MSTSISHTPVKRVYVSRNLYERVLASRRHIKRRCEYQEQRIAYLNRQVIAFKELAEATAALAFHREQDPAALRRYNKARRAVA